MTIAIKVENISKEYRLGLVGSGTLAHDINRWWCKLRGKEDPDIKVGEINDRTTVGDSDYVWALRNIDFEVKRGEVIGIIGRNGAGKSTLLKILSRVTAPTTGRIKIKGRIASLLEVGTGFHPELTGRENIYLNGAIMGMTKPEIASKLDEIVDFSGCARYIDTPVKRYSSGMTVRLGFAVAAHLEPEILIVDEVLAVGDLEFQAKCLGKMKEVAGRGRTVLFVSHNMVSIRRLCQSGLLLENGTISQMGDIESVVSAYEEMAYNNKEDLVQHGPLQLMADAFNTDHDVKLIEFKILDENDSVPITVYTWDWCRFSLIIHSQSKIPWAGVDLAVTTIKGDKVFSIASHLLTGDTLSLEEGPNHLDVNIKQLPLAGGPYFIHFGLSKPGSTYVLPMRAIARLKVTGKDVYGSGYALEQSTTPIIVDAQIGKH